MHKIHFRKIWNEGQGLEQALLAKDNVAVIDFFAALHYYTQGPPGCIPPNLPSQRALRGEQNVPR
jgi:hypothetical protein